MCGIVGIVNFKDKLLHTKEVVKKMCDSISHRGPDEFGYHYEDNLVLCHRRLSIIDLSGGKQPMQSVDNNYTVTYNGEIYNFKNIRNELEKLGHTFTSHSDTEVLLNAFIEYGVECFTHFNGMFAVAIWNKKSQELVIARDKTGKKPLYYCYKNNMIVFASELKAIYPANISDKQIDNKAVQDYFTLGYVPTPRTIYKDIQKLPPASYAIIKKESLKISTYWDIKFQAGTDSYNNYRENSKKILFESVERRLVSDVPFGAFLSGGIDSSVIVSMMQEIMDTPVKTFSIGFDVDEFSELNDARQIANRLGTEHTEFVIDKNCLNIYDEFIDFYDEPFADSSSLPTYYVSKLASEHVKMVLTGDGGDECFGGYKRYSRHLLNNKIKTFFPDNELVYKMLSSIPHYGNRIERVVKRANAKFPQNYLQEVALCSDETIASLIPTINGYSTYDSFQTLFSKQSTELDSIYYGDIKSYMLDDILVKVDRMSMANSIELRSPFLDPNLLEYAATIPEKYKTNRKVGKIILRDIASDYVSNSVVKGKKRGFAIPLKEWFKHDLKTMLQDLMNSNSRSDLFDYDFVNNLISQHDNNGHDNSELLWQILCFERWSIKYN